MSTIADKESSPTSAERFIEVIGAREHNLKNINVKIPKNKFVVVTGPSGSGKSSLAFDTIFAEGQRRYIESLSAYARQFVEQLKKPEVDAIRGICPSIAIQQKSFSKNPRSTAGTLTEIYDFLRLLFSRVGKAQCPDCHIELSNTSLDEIHRQVMRLKPESRINILTLVANKRKGEFAEEIKSLIQQGIVRARIDGSDISLTKGMLLEKQKPHTIEAYIDRLHVKESSQARIREALELATSLFDGLVIIELLDSGERLLFGKRLSCPECRKAFPELSPRLFSFNSPLGACAHCHGLGFLVSEDESSPEKICEVCDGRRLNKIARSVYIDGKDISDINEMPVTDARAFTSRLAFEGNQKIIADKVLKEILDRLGFLEDVGVGYLTLSRSAATLSGGEEQRLHLATQMGSKLTGVAYILDEPSIGLHQIDNQRLLKSLRSLQESGNTVIVIEHDLDTMLAADHIIDMGPGAGRFGGFIVDEGSPQKLNKGVTADFLHGRRHLQSPASLRSASDWIHIHGATKNNIDNLDIKIPLKTFTTITGVSGSGKSTLVMDILYPSLSTGQPIHCRSLKTDSEIDKVIAVDQSAIGRSPRSNPATYIGLFDLIRDLFKDSPVARTRGYKASRFSFNLKGGRCETCRGAGLLDIEMNFLPDVKVTCETCSGRRYNEPTLQAIFKGRNIYEVLEMSFEESLEFFSAIPQIKAKIQTMNDVGLGYLKLGQSALTLSGGEAQRLKLAKELSRKSTGNTLYIFDEPTTGLHFVDIEKLISIMQQLVDMGNSVVTIEHQLDIIRASDYIIDMGPDGGAGGGRIMAAGTPNEIARHPSSKTGRFIVAS